MYATKAIKLNDSNWAEVVEKGSFQKPVIVDFTASYEPFKTFPTSGHFAFTRNIRVIYGANCLRWCAPCRILGPTLSEAVESAGDVTLAAYGIELDH